MSDRSTAHEPDERPGREPHGAPPRPYAIVAQLPDVDSVMAAAETLRDRGFDVWDVHTPFPVHGINKAMGLRPTILPWIAFVHGVIGALLGLLLVWWTNATTFGGLPASFQGYEYLVSGKPRFSLPANIPIIFETAVLLAAFGTVLGLFGLNKHPMLNNPLLRSPRFRRVTADGFFVVIEAEDPQFDPVENRALLASCGAMHIEIVTEAPGWSERRRRTPPRYHRESFPFPSPGRLRRELRLPRPPAWMLAAALLLVALAAIPLTYLLAARSAPSPSPRVHLIQDMGVQPKYGPQSPSAAFTDGRASRPPPPGTVARDRLADDDHYDRGYVVRTDPQTGEESHHFFTGLPARIERTDALLERGETAFQTMCRACHGADGDGRGPLHEWAVQNGQSRWVPPTSLLSEEIRERPDGHLYNTIRQGIRSMPPHADQLTVADRWAVIAYIRNLQQNAAPQAAAEE